MTWIERRMARRRMMGLLRRVGQLRGRHLAATLGAIWRHWRLMGASILTDDATLERRSGTV